jgi:hypothetical protein
MSDLQAFKEGTLFFFQNVANRVPNDAASYLRSTNKPAVVTSKFTHKYQSQNLVLILYFV